MAARKTRADKSSDLARRIWLAGIGAYGRAFDDAQETYEKVSKETAKRFEELVEKGEGLEDAVAEAGKNLMPQMRKQTLTIEDRLDRMRRSLGLVAPGEDVETRLEAIEERLEGIDEKLDRLLAQEAPKKSTRGQSKPKTPKTKTTAKRAAKR